jgi:hypothetical protein
MGYAIWILFSPFYLCLHWSLILAREGAFGVLGLTLVLFILLGAFPLFFSR